LANQREDRCERDRLRGGGNRRQAKTRCDFAVVRDAALGEMRILRPQPYAMPERRRVLHRTEEQLRVDQRYVGMRKGDASGFGELAHFGERRAAELVTPPATAASTSDSSVALYSNPGSRRRAEQSMRPGQTTSPRASIARCVCQPGGVPPIAATLPAAMKSDVTRSIPCAGSIRRPFFTSIFMTRSV